MQRKIIPVIFTVALSISVFFALSSINGVQGNAKVVNYTGIVRGATQKLVKQEMSGIKNDDLIQKLDDIIDELRTGEGENKLIRLPDDDYQNQLSKIEGLWINLKNEIKKVRNGENSKTLYKLSEEYFKETDLAVSDAEVYTESEVQKAKWGLVIVTAICLSVTAFITFLVSYIYKRQNEINKIQDENNKKSEYLTMLAKQLQAPMNEMSELIYITDVETNELLFLNAAGQESFQVDSFYGQKCYKVLQGRDSPCPFCNNNLLKENENITWEYTNPITQKHYLLKDRFIVWDNRKARMEIAFDLTENETEKKQLQYLFDAEQMLITCIQSLYKKQDVYRSINEILERIGQFLLADRTYYANIQEQKLCISQEWHKDNLDSLKNGYQDISEVVMQRWAVSFKNQKCLIIEDIELLKEEVPEEYDLLKKQGIQCMIAASIEINGELNGFIGIDNPPANKLHNIVSLLQTLSYFIELSIQRDMSEKQLASLSYHDTLTSFFNRNRFIEDVQKISVEKQSVGVIYIDINGLKDINDVFGHASGDNVIIDAALYMKKIFSHTNIYRIGGDEFVILCLHMNKDRFIDDVKEFRNLIKENELLKLALGYKWSDDSTQIQALIKEADASMYEDKRNYYRTHPTSQRYRHTNDELLYLADQKILTNEIEEGHFLVYLQPKICSKDNHLEGAEALIRYCGNYGQIFLPKDFLPLLTEHNLISQIDYYVLECVCKLISHWQKNNMKIIPISVNLSQQSMMKSTLATDLLEICNQYNVSPDMIELEVSEKMNEMTEKELFEIIRLLKDNQFRIALDDFGTESANFTLLSSNDFDILKIDRSIVMKLGYESRTKKIVHSISELCQNLEISIVAEGIETQEQLDTLMSCDIYTVQGFFYGKPASVDEFEEKYIKS